MPFCHVCGQTRWNKQTQWIEPTPLMIKHCCCLHNVSNNKHLRRITLLRLYDVVQRPNQTLLYYIAFLLKPFCFTTLSSLTHHFVFKSLLLSTLSLVYHTPLFYYPFSFICTFFLRPTSFFSSFCFVLHQLLTFQAHNAKFTCPNRSE